MSGGVISTDTSVPRPGKGRSAAALLGWLVLCFGASASAAFGPVDGWYASLIKPSWNPPGWVFGPVWSMLYAMMATSAWLVWRQGGWRTQRRALGWFLVQWALNVLWTPLFFGMHLPGWAFAEMLALWVAIVITLALFWRVQRLAGVLLVPYLLWVSFAAFLNFTLWKLNS